MRARSLAVAMMILGVAGYSNASAQTWGGRPPVGYHRSGNDDKCRHDDDKWNKRGHDRHDDDRDCCDDDRRGDHGRRDRRWGWWGWGDHRDGHGNDKDDDKDCGAAPAASGTISGSVSGDNGAVSGWTVFLIPQGGGSGTSTTTSANGSFSFGNLAAGTYMVCESDPTPDAEQLPANCSSTTAAPCSTGAAYGYSLTISAGSILTGIDFLNGSGGVAF